MVGRKYFYNYLVTHHGRLVVGMVAQRIMPMGLVSVGGKLHWLTYVQWKV